MRYDGMRYKVFGIGLHGWHMIWKAMGFKSGALGGVLGVGKALS
jgi:hypothetical protein